MNGIVVYVLIAVVISEERFIRLVAIIFRKRRPREKQADAKRYEEFSHRFPLCSELSFTGCLPQFRPGEMAQNGRGRGYQLAIVPRG